MTRKLALLVFFLVTTVFSAAAQDSKLQPGNADGLSFYPNPVSNGKIYLTSKTTLDKEVIVFDVLGKKVYQIIVSSKEVNLSNLLPGVYIIKLREGEFTSTRKLIIK